MKLQSVFVLPLFLVLFLIAACTPPPTTGGDTGTTPKPEEVCTGEVCADVIGDSAGTGDLEVLTGDTDDATAKPDEKDPEEVVCNECQEGEFKCLSETLFVGCVNKNGCWKWENGAKACDDQSVCACINVEGDEQVCVPEDGKGCICVPDCEGKECGADGCGDDCWYFEGQNEGVDICLKDDSQWFCNPMSGACDEICEDDCKEGEMMCNETKVQYCIDVKAEVPDEEPCWKFDTAIDCPEFQECTDDGETQQCACLFEPCGEGCCQTEEEVCFNEECLVPDCEGKECGSDGAGGDCGTCEDGFQCLESGICKEMEVCPTGICDEGDVKCPDETNVGYQDCVIVNNIGGEDCWSWSTMKPCDAGYECVDPGSNDAECICVPDCEGKNCGSDGCEGECGDCLEDFGPSYKCSEEQVCECVCDDVPPGAVCDYTDGAMVEYENWCEAECSGIPSSQDNCTTGYCKGTCPGCEDECSEADLAPMDYCGIDMVTYPNFCSLKCGIGAEDCVSNVDCPQVVHPGACKPDCCEDEGCDPTYEPVCGSDGNTYCNICTINKCPADPNDPPTPTCLGECGDAMGCDCPNDCDNVCGMLGGQKKNFLNQCMLDCLGGEKLWDGECCFNASQTEDYVCADIEGTMKVFLNEDFLNCQSPGSLKLFDIPKTKSGEWWKEVCEDCQCDMSVEAPVCGTDWSQYGNTCALECAAGMWPDTIEATPVCDAVCEAPDCENACDLCPCPTETEGLPIDQETLKVGLCGAAGNTYGNACSAAKYGEKVVSQIWCSACAEQCQDDPVNPVCCEDGVTYPMACIPEKCNEFLNPVNCNKGKCCLTDEDCDDGDPGTTTDDCKMLDGKPWGVCENY